MRDNGTGNVIRNMRKWEAMKMAGIDGLGRITASEAAAKAKTLPQEESWFNRTGDARRGLYGRWRKENKVIELGHRVNYGPHLELGFNGRHAVLEKTINAIKNNWFKNVKRIIGL